MSRGTKKPPLPAPKFEPSITETVEMTEIDGLEQGAILKFMDFGKRGEASEEKELKTCCGDLYVIINALRDYANILDSVVEEWGVTGYHAAGYQLHAERCRIIAKKYSVAIGYDYDKAVERCQKRRSKGKEVNDIGMDGLEAWAQKDNKTNKEKE